LTPVGTRVCAAAALAALALVLGCATLDLATGTGYAVVADFWARFLSACEIGMAGCAVVVDFPQVGAGFEGAAGAGAAGAAGLDQPDELELELELFEL